MKTFLKIKWRKTVVSGCWACYFLGKILIDLISQWDESNVKDIDMNTRPTIFDRIETRILCKKIWALHLGIFIPYILLLNEARFLFLFTNQMYKHLRTHIYIYLILFRSLLKPNVKPILFFLLVLFPMFGVVVFVIYPYSHMS